MGLKAQRDLDFDFDSAAEEEQRGISHPVEPALNRSFLHFVTSPA